MGQIKIMKNILTEWRKYLQETTEAERKIFPAKVYYGTDIENLPSIRDNGIVNLPTDAALDREQIGVPTCSKPSDAKSFGNVVLELSGEYLKDSMQYETYPNSKGCRIGMKDSAVSSGSGVDDKMVDTLGTNIPFTAVTGIIFSSTPNLKQLQENGFGNIEISSFSPNGEEIKSLYKPQQED